MSDNAKHPQGWHLRLVDFRSRSARTLQHEGFFADRPCSTSAVQSAAGVFQKVLVVAFDHEVRREQSSWCCHRRCMFMPFNVWRYDALTVWHQRRRGTLTMKQALLVAAIFEVMAR